MTSYFFASPIDVDIRLEGEDIRKQVDIKQEKEKVVSSPVFYDGDSVGGQVRLLHVSVPHHADQYCAPLLGSNQGSRRQEADA